MTVIALPHNWCDYGALLTAFTAQFNIPISELNPNGGSGDELTAISSNQSGGAGAPDVVDVGLAFGPKAITQGLIQPYMVSTWSTIPASASL